jgi:serine/threonine-protein kinase
MTLAPHTRLGHYEILAPLGAGGMGEVYRAKDTRLGREVAIKVLPQAFVRDEERLRRFEREAKVLATLNHPNIAQIFGVDRQGDTGYLVLELVSGENLAERLARGPLPIDEALDVCRQIAEGLEAAHEAGVIHRDLKPANVRITPADAVKVLDFGLAKTIGRKTTTEGGRVTTAEPDSALMTEDGVVMGTPTYMSPEQARGKPLDRRTDVWAFGCVLFECLSGTRAFDGDTFGDAVASILHDEPDWSRLPAATPVRVVELVRRCLVKDPRQRLRDVGDARLELESALGDGGPLAAADGKLVAGRRLRLSFGAAALVLFGAAAGWWIAGRGSTQNPPAPSPVFHVAVPLSTHFDGLVAIAPDASYLIYQSKPREGDPVRAALTTRWLDHDETSVIQGTEDVFSAVLSSDGRWLAFLAVKDPDKYEMTLKRMPLENGRRAGPPTTVCETVTGWMTLCFGSEQEIVLAKTLPEGQLAVVPAQGGEPRVVLQEEKQESRSGMRGWWRPRPLPGGRAVLVNRIEAEGARRRSDLEVVDLSTGERKRVLENSSAAEYLPTGHLLALRDGVLAAAPFDLSRREVQGEMVPILAGLSDAGMDAPFATSRTGVLALAPRPAGEAQRRLAWIDAEGRATPLEGATGPYGWAEISRDGRRVAYQFHEASADDLPKELWVHDVDRRTTTRLDDPGMMGKAIWNPDREMVTYGRGVREGHPALWERRADGTDEPARLYAATTSEALLAPLSWTADGVEESSRSSATTSGTAGISSSCGCGSAERAAPRAAPRSTCRPARDCRGMSRFLRTGAGSVTDRMNRDTRSSTSSGSPAPPRAPRMPGPGAGRSRPKAAAPRGGAPTVGRSASSMTSSA